MYYPEGILSSMVTCFDEKGNVNLKRLGETIEFQKKAGVKSLCVLGGTGEAASMTPEERHAVMEETMKHSNGLHIVFGALAGKVSDVKADIEKAKELGADAAMVMAMPFVRPSEYDVEVLVKEYASIGLPIVVFNTPSRSAFSMSASLVKRLSEIPGVVGIKESSGNMTFAQDIRVACPHPFSLLTGGDDLYFETRIIGGDGGILAAAAVIPEVCMALDTAIKRNDIETARKCHYAVKIINDVLYTASHPVPLKLAMEARGLKVGKCRPPFSIISKEHEEQVYAALKEIRETMNGIVTFVEEYPMP